MAAGFSVSITAVDGATATIDRITKRISAMTAPARQFNKSVEKLGDVSGVNRLAEGMQSLGGRSLDVFRSMERIVPSLGAITGAASIAGVATLVAQFAKLGQSTLFTGQKLGIPVAELSAFQGAAKIAGVQAGSLEASFGSLYKNIHDAAYRNDPAATNFFRQIGVQFKDGKGVARQVGDVTKDIAEAVKTRWDSGDKDGARRIAERAGMTDLLPLLLKGKKGIEALQAQTGSLGGIITPKMATDAAAAQESINKLEIALQGVANRLGDDWASLAKPYTDWLSTWIGKNQEAAENIGKIATAMGLLAALKPAAWLLRFLGLGALADPIVPAAIGAGLGAYDIYKRPFGNVATQDQEDAVTGHAPSGARSGLPGGGLGGWWDRHAPTWAGGGAAPSTIRAPPLGSTASVEQKASHDFWRSKGLTEKQTAGWLVNEGGESGFNPKIWDSSHTQYGIFQYTGERLKALQARYHTAEPSADQQREFAWDELQTTHAETLRQLRANADSSGGSASAIAKTFEIPAATNQRAAERARDAPQFETADAARPSPVGTSGHVQVDVTLGNVTPGTTVKLGTKGAVNASPARVDTAMQQ